MLRGSQFTLSTILAATLIVALLLTFYEIGIVVLIVLEFALVFFGVELLLRQLPKGVKKALEGNCTRADGSWSTKREHSERKAIRKLRMEIWLVFLIVMVPFNLIFLFVFSDFMDGKANSGTAIGIAIAWLLAGFLIVRSGYLYFLQQFVAAIKIRAQNYILRDLQLHVDADRQNSGS